ncbi:hypothetical protein B0H17DRAFT_1218766 [Mycena rosella]|uniref:DUF6535 domain-containing protein n=1 Tax=Mycena rosella TaxID=1033263 RepID=A0AAD7BN06_MYCRO|nr:hypothetical protein B0H17DRAFT_1218766 [Mycena rosella]
MDTTDAPSDLNITPAIVKLISLMEEQISVLHRIDQRQAAADISTQPIPQVPATSSSTWGALLRSRIVETIQPKVDRWRSGLDALLVFLGLFSAIVTSFLIDSLSGLQQDEAARTNELLANLTEILIQLNSGANVSTVKIALPTHFQPEAVDVRLNSYWSISLILSLSIAALAVACRGFLNVAVLSSHASAADKLIDINTRWKAAEKMLGPALEVIPQFLFLPVVLFVVGLLDSIFSSILSLEILPTPIAAASGLSLFFVAGVVAFLAFALVDASVRPDTSPFQSNLAHVFSKTLKFAHLHGKYKKEGPSRRTRIESTYHEIVQATHDDETLDKASAALLGILEPSFTWHHSLHHLNETLDHLLSPEASLRCNHTAAQVIVDLPRIFNRGNRHLLPSLVEAAQRSANYRSMATLWTSTYVKACAVLVGAFQDEHPAVVCIIGSSYVFTVQDLHQQLSMDYLLVTFSSTFFIRFPQMDP